MSISRLATMVYEAAVYGGIRNRLVSAEFKSISRDRIPIAMDHSLRLTLKHPHSKKPSEYQVNILKYYKELGFDMSSLPLDEWCAVIRHFDGFLMDGHTYDLYKRSTRVFDIWAEIHSKSTIAGKMNVPLVLMDGHGRFVSRILQMVAKKNDKDFILEIVDLDPTITEWHELFFPSSNVQSKCNNILDYPTDCNLVYMNFCGLHGQNDKIFANYESSAGNFFISFSNARNHVRNMQLLDNMKTATIIGCKHRYDFVSYYIEKMCHDEFVAKCMKQSKARDNDNVFHLGRHNRTFQITHRNYSW